MRGVLGLRFRCGGVGGGGGGFDVCCRYYMLEEGWREVDGRFIGAVGVSL